MAKTVKATQEALDAITSMKRIIEGGLMDSINQMNQQGQILSEPNNWAGPRADQFRSDWQEWHRSLVQAQDSLAKLNKQAQDITNAIMAAGGF